MPAPIEQLANLVQYMTALHLQMGFRRYFWGGTKGPSRGTQSTNQANESHGDGNSDRLKDAQRPKFDTEASRDAPRRGYHTDQDTSYPPKQQSTTAGLIRVDEQLGTLAKRNAVLEKILWQTESKNEQLATDRDLYKRRTTELSGINREQEGRLKDFEGELRRMQEDWKSVSNKLLIPYRNERLSNCSPTEQQSLEFVLGRLQGDAFETAPLRERYQRLQQEMLANVERIQSISDEQFQQQYRNLSSAIKVLSRSVSPQAFDKTTGSYGEFRLLQGVPEEYWGTRSRKKSQIEAVVWSILVDKVFWNPFVAFGTADPVLAALAAVWTDTFGSYHYHEWPIPSASSETWRYITFEHLFRSVPRDIFAGEDSDSNTAGGKKSVVDAQYAVLFQLCQVFQGLEPDYDTERLIPIVHKAFALAVDMFSQRCRFQIMWPQLGEEYLFGETTGLTSMPDSDEVQSGRVVFIVNPGLTKWGDAHGKCLDQRLDIVPALVFIEEQAQQTPDTEANELQAETVSSPEETWGDGVGLVEGKKEPFPEEDWMDVSGASAEVMWAGYGPDTMVGS